MLSKLVCAVALAGSGSTALAHSLHTRDLPAYPKVNRDSGYGAPQAPAEGYGAPAPSYSAPEPAYEAPDTGYGAPDTGYGAPASSYGAPSYNDAPSYGAQEEAGLDLTSILIPILALLGLSLLFPTYVSVTSRKKRSLDGTGELNQNRYHTHTTCIKAQKLGLRLISLDAAHLGRTHSF